MLISLAVSLFASFAAVSSRPLGAEPTCARPYTISEGDTCFSISASQGVSLSQLYEANPFINEQCDLLIRQQLCLGWQGKDCTQTYVVETGDTCDSISLEHSITTQQLYDANKRLHSNCDNLYIGTAVCVAGSVAPAAPAPVPAPAPAAPAPAKSDPTPAPAPAPAKPDPTPAAKQVDPVPEVQEDPEDDGTTGDDDDCEEDDDEY